MARGTGLFLLSLLLLSTFTVASSQTPGRGPTNPKAQKTYAEAQDRTKHRDIHERIDEYRKADKQDGYHCVDCALQAAKLALKAGDNKLAREEAIELEVLDTTPEGQSKAHFLHGVAMLNMGAASHKDRDLTEADGELQKAIAVNGGEKLYALYEDGIVLAYLHHDDAARARFREFCSNYPPGGVDYVRAKRYEKQPELARQRMAPAFTVTTLSGQQISLDSLQGQVVLIDFWATWCGPCREALPRIQGIAKRFDGQPLVVLSISLDKDEAKWKDFVAKHHMTWAQYRDGDFDGTMAQMFGVHAIPATFTIDSDGVLQDQHVGDAAIEGKLKKLVAAAGQREVPPPALGAN
jgi:thiol-disulfide isomerase/thioredoxin/TolA-binding protein